MYIPEEITAPEVWTSVRIETAGVEADVVEELLFDIKETQLRVVQEGTAIVVYKNDDEIGLNSFENGVVPDLRVRGFRATWQEGL